MKQWGVLLLGFMVLVGLGCEETDELLNTDQIEWLSSGIWEVSADTEVGQVGAQMEYHADGTARVRESANLDWYPDVLTWSLSDDGGELILNGADGPGTMDKFEILELDSTRFRGRIIESTSSEAVGKIMIMVEASEPAENDHVLTQGIWEVSADTEVGQVGAQLEYHADGTARVRESASSAWYPDVLTWSLSTDEGELTMTGTNGPGTMDKFEVLELDSTRFRGRIIDSTSSDAISKVMKMFNIPA